ncbi:hypothetical protein TELCIR_08764 [Teladorsagia circumcincta]|uniref:Uncharacterized protein n=1 Tax=Teladorsagia circumcincta TaxID=45464 RepID=A0A2G9UGM6_TELCI|nr:hypothetical protein TELCIR_08764 [Teladorsagia circumcincta]
MELEKLRKLSTSSYPQTLSRQQPHEDYADPRLGNRRDASKEFSSVSKNDEETLLMVEIEDAKVPTDYPVQQEIEDYDPEEEEIMRTVKKENGLKGALWGDHLFKAVWKWQCNKEAKLYSLWKEIARQYPLAE